MLTVLFAVLVVALSLAVPVIAHKASSDPNIVNGKLFGEYPKMTPSKACPKIALNAKQKAAEKKASASGHHVLLSGVCTATLGELKHAVKTDYRITNGKVVKAAAPAIINTCSPANPEDCPTPQASAPGTDVVTCGTTDASCQTASSNTVAPPADPSPCRVPVGYPTDATAGPTTDPCAVGSPTHPAAGSAANDGLDANDDQATLPAGVPGNTGTDTPSVNPTDAAGDMNLQNDGDGMNAKMAGHGLGVVDGYGAYCDPTVTVCRNSASTTATQSVCFTNQGCWFRSHVNHSYFHSFAEKYYLQYGNGSTYTVGATYFDIFWSLHGPYWHTMWTNGWVQNYSYSTYGVDLTDVSATMYGVGTGSNISGMINHRVGGADCTDNHYNLPPNSRPTFRQPARFSYQTFCAESDNTRRSHEMYLEWSWYSNDPKVSSKDYWWCDVTSVIAYSSTAGSSTSYGFHSLYGPNNGLMAGGSEGRFNCGGSQKLKVI